MPQIDPIKTTTDQDGDIIMSDTTILPLNAFRDKFNFDWFSFDGKTAPPKSPTYSPASPNSTRNLSISTASPSSYFTGSPLSSEPPSRNAFDLGSTNHPKVKYPSPPAKPLKWVWQCHLCHSRYPLSVTRRCLIDGHYYCSGNSQTQRNVKKRRKHQSCTSEFDYVAWKEWGQWRRKTMALKALTDGKAEPKLLGCDGCSSPSQCRYDKRKPVEIVKFDDFVCEDDIIVDADDLVPPEMAISEANSQFTATLPLKGEKTGKVKRPAVKKSLKLDVDSSSTLSQKSSKRFRFYSNLAGNLSTRDASPTSESSSSLDQGKFDPTLPSVTRSSTSGDNDLKVIETTLKAALASQSQDTPKEDVSKSTTKSRRRINSKVSDPQFEVTAEDIQNGLGGYSEINELYRTRSQQSLLTDFFRQTRSSPNGDPIKRDATLRAASEADIAAFLQSKPVDDLDELNTRIQRHRSLQTNNGQHFEEINLSPSKTSSIKKSLAPTEIENPTSDVTEAGSDARSAQSNVGGETGRAGISFGFPTFVFGRK